MNLRVIIADDEPLSIDMLSILLSEIDPNLATVDIVATCQSGRETLQAIDTHQPDLVFLDISMPDGTGIEVVQHIKGFAIAGPAVIFTTAHADFAARAFDLEADDYLLKPLTTERLAQALRRLARKPNGPRHNRIAVPVLGGIEFIDPQEIEWVQAAGDYITLHTDNRSLMIRKTLSSFARDVGPVLKRTHRSYLINPDRVVKILPKSKGEAMLQVCSGACIPLSRRHRDLLSVLADKPPPALR